MHNTQIHEMTESMSNNAADFVNSSKYNDKKSNWYSSYKFGINKHYGQWSHGRTTWQSMLNVFILSWTSYEHLLYLVLLQYRLTLQCNSEIVIC